MRTLRVLFPVLMLAAAAPHAGAQTPAPPAAQAAAPTPPPPGFRGEFLEQFNTSMSKFVALAMTMPEDKYAWSPGTGVHSVRRVYIHVGRYNYNYPEMMGLAAPAGVTADSLEASAMTKEQVIDYLRRSREHVRAVVNNATDEQLSRPADLYGRQVPQWAVLFQLLAHMNEHLGQSIAYARMNGVTPPWSQ
jgi:uncharacterized damage-inducible protein DinB